MDAAQPTWLFIVLLGGVVAVGLIVLAVVLPATRKPMNASILTELDRLREEVAHLREEVRDLKKARLGSKSTDITDLG